MLCDENTSGGNDQDPARMPIDGTLDLHMFSPRDVKDLVPAYIEECLARGILDLRIVHGKGIGTLRAIVQGILDKHPAVVWYGHAENAGSWGATVVRLSPPGPGSNTQELESSAPQPGQPSQPGKQGTDQDGPQETP